MDPHPSSGGVEPPDLSHLKRNLIPHKPQQQTSINFAPSGGNLQKKIASATVISPEELHRAQQIISLVDSGKIRVPSLPTVASSLPPGNPSPSSANFNAPSSSIALPSDPSPSSENFNVPSSYTAVPPLDYSKLLKPAVLNANNGGNSKLDNNGEISNSEETTTIPPIPFKPIVYIHGEPTIQYSMEEINHMVFQEELQYAVVGDKLK